METSKAQLRTALLNQRIQLSSKQQSNAANTLVEQIKSNAALAERFQRAEHILSYAPFKGEISSGPLLEELRASIYLPRIIDYKVRLMAFYPSNLPQNKNRFGILEPQGDALPTAISDFSIAIIPLVAFDLSANRLGMGAGFYDRALQPLKELSKRPLLIGLAHPFQEVKSTMPDSWDRPLDVILTGEKIIDPNNILKPPDPY